MILKAAWVVPVTAPPIPNGFVDIANGRIAAVGSASALPADAARAADDLGSVVLTPGLVNPHTHLELTRYHRKLEPAPFWPWIEQLVRLRIQPGRIERERSGAGEGAWLSLRAGVTCVGDISRENVAWQALQPIPIRKVCFAELLSLAADPPRNPAELRAAFAEIAEDDLLTAAVTPHAPYTVPEDHIRAVVELADEMRRPWCTHWAETREEMAFLAGDSSTLPPFMLAVLRQCGVRSPRLPALEYLSRCTAGGSPGALAHMNYADPAQMDRLAARGDVVVYCPRAHRFFGHPPHPFRHFQAAGVTVAIGTDSLASNDSLSILDELRYVRQHVADAPPPADLLRMATLDGARALRLQSRIGSLEPGKLADLAAFPCPSGSQADPLAVLIDNAPAPAAVWVAGRRVI